MKKESGRSKECVSRKWLSWDGRVWACLILKALPNTASARTGTYSLFDSQHHHVTLRILVRRNSPSGASNMTAGRRVVESRRGLFHLLARSCTARDSEFACDQQSPLHSQSFPMSHFIY